MFSISQHFIIKTMDVQINATCCKLLHILNKHYIYICALCKYVQDNNLLQIYLDLKSNQACYLYKYHH